MADNRAKWQKHNMAYVHECDDAEVIICYPKKPTEFDVQEQLYGQLVNLCHMLDNGSEVKSEVTVYCDGIQSRFDLMVFKWNGAQEVHAMCGIEVKRGGWINNPEQHERQKTKYAMIQRMAKIPVYFCNGMEEIEKTVKKIGDLIA